MNFIIIHIYYSVCFQTSTCFQTSYIIPTIFKHPLQSYSYNPLSWEPSQNVNTFYIHNYFQTSQCFTYFRIFFIIIPALLFVFKNKIKYNMYKYVFIVYKYHRCISFSWTYIPIFRGSFSFMLWHYNVIIMVLWNVQFYL